MSLWSRIVNVVRLDRVSREIDEELEAHIEAAIEDGRDPVEARRALGSALRHREASLDARVATWLQSLRADGVFALRQLRKRKATSVAAVLSLGLAMGACMTAFRLIDATLLRPLPIVDAARLYTVDVKELGPDGKFSAGDDRCSNALFGQMRAAVREQATVLAISEASPVDLTYGSVEETERAYEQWVSGDMFAVFGLRPAVGRLFTASDDLQRGTPRYTVLSYDYWTRRFGRDPGVVGRTYRIGEGVSEIVGVLEKGFTGVERGATVDLFVPRMANDRLVSNPDWLWFRTFAQLKPGVSADAVRARLEVELQSYVQARYERTAVEDRAVLARRGKRMVVLERAQAGASRLQRLYRLPLTAIGILVGLVMLISCANVANLLSGQASARSRETALRVALGAGRQRLVQLAVVEGAYVAALGACVGAFLAWWAAPFVVRLISSRHDPVQLLLPVDWRVLGFGLTLAFSVTVLFAVGPVVRSAGVDPVLALKQGDGPRDRRRRVNVLIAVQVTFCFIAVFVGGLFSTTFHRLVNRPVGFSAGRILTIAAIAPPQEANPVGWRAVAEHLRSLPGVENVALAGWPLLNGDPGTYSIWLDGERDPRRSFQVPVSPGWLDLMRISLIAGRDFRPDEPAPRVALVSQSFARQYLAGADAVGKSFGIGRGIRLQIVGVVGDVLYNTMRDPDSPVVYVPFDWMDPAARSRILRGTFLVRTSTPDPLALAETLQRAVLRARPGFRVASVRTQEEVNASHLLRERLLALLSSFFAAVALALAGVGLYGVLSYSVLERRREIGIRLAIGAPSGHVVRCVVARVFAMVLVGSAVGLLLGRVTGRYIETLLYGVKTSDVAALALPVIAVIGAAVLAALAPLLRAVRIDPAATLRLE
jgi:predicted permease